MKVIFLAILTFFVALIAAQKEAFYVTSPLKGSKFKPGDVYKIYSLGQAKDNQRRSKLMANLHHHATTFCFLVFTVCFLFVRSPTCPWEALDALSAPVQVPLQYLTS
ncbi:uncharacterized protein BYT42DRAFT_608261 [Radiomyces spectabilis]|uniref:uncharacterized protein n=1 Tax=Radiomyces spectabilis TaxID=64574 RepID=UPI00222099EE|nr:uncharacterized protein BYT42DRAFT_608261 [Radiomyces spectabilis]KAI8367571.1 hypothetical protein BYT42DRAFT_608261 [Radiomyces spectabilis]